MQLATLLHYALHPLTSIIFVIVSAFIFHQLTVALRVMSCFVGVVIYMSLRPRASRDAVLWHGLYRARLVAKRRVVPVEGMRRHKEETTEPSEVGPHLETRLGTAAETDDTRELNASHATIPRGIRTPPHNISPQHYSIGAAREALRCVLEHHKNHVIIVSFALPFEPRRRPTSPSSSSSSLATGQDTSVLRSGGARTPPERERWCRMSVLDHAVAYGNRKSCIGRLLSGDGGGGGACAATTVVMYAAAGKRESVLLWMPLVRVVFWFIGGLMAYHRSLLYQLLRRHHHHHQSKVEGGGEAVRAVVLFPTIVPTASTTTTTTPAAGASSSCASFSAHMNQKSIFAVALRTASYVVPAFVCPSGRVVCGFPVSLPPSSLSPPEEHSELSRSRTTPAPLVKIPLPTPSQVQQLVASFNVELIDLFQSVTAQDHVSLQLIS